MERNCKTCFYCEKNCYDIIGDCLNYNKWRSKEEKKEIEKIQMTEEQAKVIWWHSNSELSEFLCSMKQLGYIKKTAVEEAEEMYNSYRGIVDTETKNLLNKQYEAIQELKEEIKKLKGE